MAIINGLALGTLLSFFYLFLYGLLGVRLVIEEFLIAPWLEFVCSTPLVSMTCEYWFASADYISHAAGIFPLFCLFFILLASIKRKYNQFYPSFMAIAAGFLTSTILLSWLINPDAIFWQSYWLMLGLSLLLMLLCIKLTPTYFQIYRYLKYRIQP